MDSERLPGYVAALCSFAAGAALLNFLFPGALAESLAILLEMARQAI